MLARGARITAMLPRRAVGCRLMSSLNNKDLAVPFHIPSIAYGNHKPSNIFVSKNVTSKFIALNRPEALNALTTEMVEELNEIYSDIKEDEACNTVVLYGASDKAFCAGGDVALLAKQKPAPIGQPCPQMDFFRKEYTLNMVIHNLVNTISPTTHIGLMNGIIMGGGAGLVHPAHYQVCTDDTIFAMPETGIGFFPDVGATYWLNRKADMRQKGLKTHVGIYLALTGRRLNANEMYSCGLATHYVSLGQVPLLLERLMKTDTPTAQHVHDTLSLHSERPDVERCGEDKLTPHSDAIERCFSHGTIEEIRSALKAEIGASVEHGKWADETLTMMDKNSPTALAVTLEAMRLGKAPDMSMEKCLQMEFRIARRFMSGGDFFEGIRAMLIEKCKTPHWDPAPSPEQIQEYFKPLTDTDELSFGKDVYEGTIYQK